MDRNSTPHEPTEVLALVTCPTCRNWKDRDGHTCPTCGEHETHPGLVYVKWTPRSTPFLTMGEFAAAVEDAPSIHDHPRDLSVNRHKKG